MPFGPHTHVGAILDDPEARALIERLLPELADSPFADVIRPMSIGAIVEHHPVLGKDDAKRQELWNALARIERGPRLVRPEVVRPDPGYEGGDVAEGSASIRLEEHGSRWSPYEIRIDGPSHGNPFTEVDLSATFTNGHDDVTVGGFYDGDGQWVIRFAAGVVGEWRFTTESSARSLRGLSGTFTVTDAAGDMHGPVRTDGFHFAHADGSRFVPFGTTAYAWLHQSPDLRAATLRTLAEAPFNKVRMTVFPKAYMYNSNEPELYPFVGSLDEGFDVGQPNPAFFRMLEAQVRALGELGVEADLILFHPYDRWGFADMGSPADDLYIRYVVRRLAAFPNVWWAMANEYDFMRSKAASDWDRLGRLVVAEDHVGHLVSIHNGTTFYDHSAGWITHASIQQVDRYRTGECVGEWRRQWGKAVVVDEIGYEGDLPMGWGDLSARELVRRCWEGALRGGYVGHGAYLRPDEQLWWAKGGELVGESPARIQFLRDVTASAPGGVLEPVDFDRECPSAGVAGQYYLVYFGVRQPGSRMVQLPPGRRYRADVLDTWNMTVEPVAGTFEGNCTVPLPGREFVALRLSVVG